MTDAIPSEPPDLLTALNITSADLAANRQGQLSETQRLRLRRAWRRTLLTGTLALIFVGLTATVLLFLGQTGGSGILTLLGIGLTIINAAIVGIGAQSLLRLNRDLHEQKVMAQETIIHRTVRIAGRNATYVLKTDGDELVVPKGVFNAFVDGARYRLYRAPASKALLSAEPIA